MAKKRKKEKMLRVFSVSVAMNDGGFRYLVVTNEIKETVAALAAQEIVNEMCSTLQKNAYYIESCHQVFTGDKVVLALNKKK